ncbi:hypothetical protein UA08_06891 [Talaromyces atroroseus]|uniref:TauD/TfdA-like domain-containing protein n=1 Tax=Talaromyces atroroseus TaxID=1441469 RepID=A0A225AEK2_TALAT|nr:hypothetical protein UA08_06891 [Talaromyces atroroseus]OKL57493.1 hypothetical protein UA08_06891 [Talaromyces atroroseus]
MPGLANETAFHLITVKELHPTFGAEINGVDFSKAVENDVFQEILVAIRKYGICVFRDTQLDDNLHVQFAAKFGELDDVTPYLAGGRPHRLTSPQLFDVGNIDLDGSVFVLDHMRQAFNKGNGLFHVDSSFNPRRAGYSLLRAHELPPKGMGGNTDFADTRAAFDDLDRELKRELLANDYVAAHSLWHSRKLASPEALKDVDPTAYPFSRHKLVQMHEPSGRMNLYIAAHVHHIEGLEEGKSKELFDKLYKHAQQPKYVLSVEWEHNGDLILWDNTSVMHRAAGGIFEGKYKRDMRRATVHDASSTAWGLNERTDVRQGLP